MNQTFDCGNGNFSIDNISSDMSASEINLIYQCGISLGKVSKLTGAKAHLTTWALWLALLIGLVTAVVPDFSNDVGFNQTAHQQLFVSNSTVYVIGAANVTNDIAILNDSGLDLVVNLEAMSYTQRTGGSYNLTVVLAKRGGEVSYYQHAIIAQKGVWWTQWYPASLCF
ncbi:hypothetical protein BABINDRAFT_160660 [Babjeviella inositovora NRRL Y-12698]|uniref:Uncharacterized protein n=1 Tax=Babjeviella inositovora NRRL Y-12698 TaxID=984486 RepID=A0A1E3QWC2_9ASCO|nr:uncharacterized protein BABINDRAFT_160660 [Babjeviella inositovora NRRL Y-12698]ODQ81297.1 hypothetical protein BABINDRAFT_160660 [Babjeviella inositovora NRRL Y-12698]